MDTGWATERLAAAMSRSGDGRRLLAALAVVAGLCLFSDGARGGAEPDESVAFFAAEKVARIELELAAEALPVLRRDPHEYVRATVREGGATFKEVGLHLKGGLGTFQSVDEKPSFTLNFDKFNKEQKFRGMDKVHLNNAAEDESLMMERLAADLFRAAGVPCPRVTQVRVTLNGRDLGMYVFKEGFDGTFLRRHFKSSDGGFYDSGLSHDIDELKPKTSRSGVKKTGDLGALWEAAHEKDPAVRLRRMGETLDVERFRTFIVMEALVGHDDGYMINKNNYRIYFDPDARRFVFMPTGMDQVFAEECPLYPNGVGYLAKVLVATPEGRRQYQERLMELYQRVWSVPAMEKSIGDMQRRIRPALERGEVKAHNKAVANLKQMIRTQTARIEEEVAVIKRGGSGTQSVRVE